MTDRPGSVPAVGPTVCATVVGCGTRATRGSRRCVVARGAVVEPLVAPVVLVHLVALKIVLPGHERLMRKNRGRGNGGCRNAESRTFFFANGDE